MTSRDEDWKRISAMAGLDENGAILPPPVGLNIDVKPSPFWKTTVPQYGYMTLDEDFADRALALIAKADRFEAEGKPAEWAANCRERAAKNLGRAEALRQVRQDAEKDPRVSELVDRMAHQIIHGA